MTGKGRVEVDTIVVGGGVIGLSVACELLRAGRRVRVVERHAPGSGATDASGGMLAPLSEVESEPPALIELGRESLALYPGFVETLEGLSGRSCGYRSEGTLWVACTRDERAELEHLAQTLQALALAPRPLSAEELFEREPHVSGRLQGGLLVESDHQVDPRALVRCLAGSVEALGGEIVGGTTVSRVVARNGRLSGLVVEGRDGETLEWPCGEVVLATGAWTGDVELPLPAPGVRPVKGQLLRLRGARLLRHVVRTPEVYLIPREDGELLVGATLEEMGFDSTPTAGPVMDLLRRAWEVLPGVYDLAFDSVSVGLRSAVSDHLPVIGASSLPGLYLAVGHYRNGVLLAPITARLLARQIVDGIRPEALSPFLPDRGSRRDEPSRAGEARGV